MTSWSTLWAAIYDGSSAAWDQYVHVSLTWSRSFVWSKYSLATLRSADQVTAVSWHLDCLITYVYVSDISVVRPVVIGAYSSSLYLVLRLVLRMMLSWGWTNTSIFLFVMLHSKKRDLSRLIICYLVCVIISVFIFSIALLQWLTVFMVLLHF